MSGTALVWGNCQADPLADLLAAPLEAAGIEMLRVPPVFLATPAELSTVHDEVSRCRLLISQPVSEEYPLPGSGTAHLASLLPHDGRLVTIPVVYHVGAFPYQVHGYDGDDGRVDAPLTDYHDLRVVRAAARKGSRSPRPWSTGPSRRPTGFARCTARRWPRSSVAKPNSTSRARPCSTAPARCGRWTIRATPSWPRSPAPCCGFSNLPDDAMRVREREYLAQRRTPVEPAVAEALGWPTAGTATEWVIDGRRVPNPELLDVQLEFYRQRPDVVSRTLFRAADRMAQLGLPR